MAAHIPTVQIKDHFLTTYKIKVDDGEPQNFSLTDTSLIVGQYEFPFDFFDIAGVVPDQFHLADIHKVYHAVSCYDKHNNLIPHPEWETEEFDEGRIRNG